MNEVDTCAKIIWDYMLMHQELKPADAILVFGSHDTRPAERGAELFLEGWAPLLVFSGGFGRVTSAEDWTKPEAEIFAEIAVQIGVPQEKILIENSSSNSELNVRYTRKLLEEKKLPANRFVVVSKPYMERRTYATFKNFWPEPEVIMASPQISFKEYAKDTEHKEKLTHLLVGDLQRVKEYPAKGFQIPQEIPPEVWSAYERLVELGYTGHLIKD